VVASTNTGRRVRLLATNFNIIAIDLKPKRQVSQPTRYGKGCKKMRKLSHRAASTFTRLAFLYSDATAVARGYRAGTGHALPSAAGYYFSRRIFPQMNFMKTVFALLINRSSVAGPRVRLFPSRGESASPKRPKRKEEREKERERGREREREGGGRGQRARLLLIILFQRPHDRAQKRTGDILGGFHARLAWFTRASSWRYAPSFHDEDGAAGKIVSSQIMMLPSCS